MKTDVERLNPTRVRLTVEVPFDELKPSVDAAYRKVAQQVQIPGFRRGKVPPPVIDRRLGRGVVLEEAIQEAIPKAYGEALREENVKALGQPELDVKEFAEDAPLNFTAEVDTRPDIEVPDYAGLPVTVESAGVTEEAVDEQLSTLRERFAVLGGVDRPVQEGDYASIDLTAESDGVELEDASVNGMSYEVGSGNLVEGLDTALSGMREGESKSFESALLGEREGQQANVTVTVGSVKEKQLPEMDDEFAQTASEYDTIEELRDDTRNRLVRDRTSQQATQAREHALDALLDLSDFPVPDRVLDEEVDNRRADLDQRLQSSGLSLEMYLSAQGQSEEDFVAEIRDSSLKSLKAGWLLDEIADADDIGVEDEELNSHLVQTAMQMGVDPQEFANHLMESGQVGHLWNEVRRNKALTRVVEQAEVTDESGEAVDLGLGGDTDEADEAVEGDQPAEAGSEPVAEADEDRPGSTE